MRHRIALLLQLLLILFCLTGLTACGKKGPVRPLLRAEPAAPGRPEVRQIGTEIILFVDLPERNQDGSPLTDLAALRIYRRENADGLCNECNEPTELWRSIDLLAPRGSGRRLVIRDSDVRPGYAYRYRLVAVTNNGLSGEALGLSRVVHPAPAPPQNLSAAGFDRMVRLAWNPSTGMAPGWTLRGCNVFRAEGDTPFGLTPLTQSLVSDGRFDDVGPQNHLRYRYQVSCLAQQEEELVESPPSASVVVTPLPE